MSTIIVPKEEQAAYALKRYKIADLSVLPADWHSETHYPDGRPLTPTVKERPERLVTEDGAWLVADEPAVDCDTPYGSPPSSPELLSYKGQLVWEHNGAAVSLSEDNVCKIRDEWVQPLLAKLIKTVRRDRERMLCLEEARKRAKKAAD